MYNDSIDILKFTQLHTLDVDRNKTTSFFNVEANELIINLYLNRHIAMESLNGRIKRIISDGYGYKDFNRFRNRVMFSLNKNEPIK